MLALQQRISHHAAQRRASVLWLCCFLFVGLLLTACQKEEKTDESINDDRNVVTVLLSPNGLGDRGYNDNIYEGVCRLKETYADSDNVVIIIQTPHSDEEAISVIESWMNEKTTHRRLLIVGGSDMTDWFDTHDNWGPRDNAEILLLDSPVRREGTYGRYISQYGACYMAGIASHCFLIEKAAVVRANPYDKNVQEAMTAFMEGFRYKGGVIGDDDVYTLADSPYAGYDMADSLHRMCYPISEKGYQFIFPICGGSAQGLYSFLRGRHHALTYIYTCGIDADQQDYSFNVAFSVVKLYDYLIEDFVSQWIIGEQQEDFKIYGFCTPYVAFIIADSFYYSDIGLETNPLIPHVIEVENAYLNIED